MSLPTTLSSTKINNNSFDIGLNSTNGTTFTTYGYDGAILATDDCIISENTIAPAIGTSSGSTNLISVSSATCNIHNNTFIRGASTIGSYILSSGSNDQIIQNNIFDHETIDGTNVNLVSGLSENSTYSNNRNQISYKGTDIFTHQKQFYSNNLDLTQTNFNGLTYFNGASPLEQWNIKLNGTTPNLIAVFQLNLNDILPDNVKILDVAIGFTFDGSNAYDTAESSTFNLNLQRTILSDFNPISYPSNLSQTVLDAYYNYVGTGGGSQVTGQSLISNIYTIDSIPTAAAPFTATQYLRINTQSPDYSDYFTLNKKYQNYINFVLDLKFSTGTLSTSVVVSPIMIRFKY